MPNYLDAPPAVSQYYESGSRPDYPPAPDALPYTIDRPVIEQIQDLRSLLQKLSNELYAQMDKYAELRQAFRQHKHADGRVVIDY